MLAHLPPWPHLRPSTSVLSLCCCLPLQNLSRGCFALSKPAPFLEQSVSLSSLCIALKPGCVLHGSRILGRAGSWCRVGRGER